MVSPVLQFVHGQLFVTPKLPPASQVRGRTMIITGANSGLGLAAAQSLHTLGASRLILACRSSTKGDAARTQVLASSRPTGLPPIIVDVWQLDMADYDSVKKFAARCAAEPGRIDAVLLNAGIDVKEFELVGGNESTLTVNVVSTFMLAMLLLEPLSVSGKKHGITPYISITGSAVHLWAHTKEIDHVASGEIFATLNDEKKADMANVQRYNLSKLLVLQCVKELALFSSERATAMGTPRVIVNCVAPGWCKTALFRHDDGGFGPRLALRLIGRTSEEGSRCLVSGVCAGDGSHGMYLSECMVKDVSPFVLSKEGVRMQKEVWGELMVKWRAIAPEADVFRR